jgi:predicted enzyme related to lactoylglutathione lyase
MLMQDGSSVAGLMGHAQDGQPTVWATYIAVADADATAERVRAAGGTVMVAPMEVMDLGRMAFCADPSGAAFGLWQPRAFRGADLVDAPNGLCWTEVLTRDAEAARAFYPAVFGWSPVTPSFPGSPPDYTVWELDGTQVAGMMPMTDRLFPPGVPSHWSVCFAVADCDATVQQARRLGATVTQEPMTMEPIGRFAALVDPQGASFATLQMPPR